MLIKVLGLNLLVFAVYALLITMDSPLKDKGFNIAIGMGFCIVTQVVLNTLSGIGFLVFGKRDLGKNFLISAAVLIPIGFVTWLFLLSLFG